MSTNPGHARKPYAEVIGDPIDHSKSPLIHNFWLARLGIDAEYRACHVRPDGLNEHFARRRADAAWRGCNITIPHKEAVSGLLDLLEAAARAVGAVNTVGAMSEGRLKGFNTDVLGISDSLAGWSKPGARVAVIGSGGAARAAFHALEGSRAAEVFVLSRRPDHAAEVARSFNIFVVGVPIEDARSLVDIDLLINASPLGMDGQPGMSDAVLSSIAKMADDASVFDMVYSPLETALLAAARASGKHAIDGLTMLVGQAAAAFELFFGQPAPREHDAELRALLTG